MTNAILNSYHSGILGSAERTLRQGATDTSGTYWPAGTRYQPSCSGEDWATGRRYCEVVILGSGAGQRVKFSAVRS